MAARVPGGRSSAESAHWIRRARRAGAWNTQVETGHITKTFQPCDHATDRGGVALAGRHDRRVVPDQPNGDKITVRMLLRTPAAWRTSSSPRRADPMWSQNGRRRNSWQIATRLVLDEPGPRLPTMPTPTSLYCMIVEAVTGNSWSKSTVTHFRTAWLKGTAFVTDEASGAGPGAGIREDGGRQLRQHSGDCELPSAGTAWALGSVVSTLSDLMTFASASSTGSLFRRELAEMATGLRLTRMACASGAGRCDVEWSGRLLRNGRRQPGLIARSSWGKSARRISWRGWPTPKKQTSSAGAAGVQYLAPCRRSVSDRRPKKQRSSPLRARSTL